MGLVMALGGQGTGRNDLFLSLTTSRAEYKAGYSLFLADKDTEEITDKRGEMTTAR